MADLSGARQVIIVEDEQELLDLMVTYCKKAGLNPIPYKSAGSAKRTIRGKKKIDALVTDLLLTDGHGLELAHYARSYRPDLVVKFVTAHSQNHHLALVEEMKAVGEVIEKKETLMMDLELLFRRLAA